jgi:hypothetical protein
MAKLPSAKLDCEYESVKNHQNHTHFPPFQAHFRLQMSVPNTIFGEGNGEARKVPTGLKIITATILLGGVMLLNGLYDGRHNFFKICSSLTIISMGVQLAARLIARLVDKDTTPLFKAHEIAMNFYRAEEKSLKRRSFLNKVVDRSVYIVNAYTVVLFVIWQLPIMTGWILTIYKQEFIMTFHLKFPYIDPTTLFGYLVYMVYQTIVWSIFYILFVLTDNHMIFYPLQTFAMVDSFKVKFEGLAERLEKLHDTDIEPTSSALTVQEILRAKKFKNEQKNLEKEFVSLIKEYETYNEYLKLCLSYLEFTVFAAISSNAIAIGLALLYARFVSIPIGLSIAILLSFQVFAPCIVGTIVAIQNERLLEIICGFPWFYFSHDKQRAFLQFIHQCQHTTEYQLAIIGALNMELFTNVMNAAYSYLMYILNFVKN